MYKHIFSTEGCDITCRCMIKEQISTNWPLTSSKLWNVGDIVYDTKTKLNFVIYQTPYYSEALKIQYFWAARVEGQRISMHYLYGVPRYKYLSSKRCIKVGKLKMKMVI